MQTKVLTGTALLLAAALTGCIGNLEGEIDQTEPFRIRVEHVDGDGTGDGTTGTTGNTGTTNARRVTVNVDSDGDDRERRVVIDKDVNVENLRVVVIVNAVGATSAPPPTTNATGGNATGGNDTAGNATGNGTASTSTEVVVRVLIQTTGGEILQQQDVTTTGGTGNADLTVNVKGKDNVVIVTQAVQGAASVDVEASEATTQTGGS